MKKKWLNSYINKENEIGFGVKKEIKAKDANDKLTLTLDNGDRKKFQQLLTDWNFKDEQSLLRFAMSVMLETTDKTLTITTENGNEKVAPVDDFIKKDC